MEGSKLGKYEIRGTIGRGAVGIVYEAWDPVLERTVAVKTLPLSSLDADGAEKHARFQREAQAAGRLNHPNIVAMFDYGETLTCAYIVMEFLPGPSLKKFLELEPRPPPAAMWHIMDGLLTGLQLSHRRGVMHRDIKPANIVFGDDNAVKITDFGVAHLENSDMTQVGSVLGTPGYMSPEQVLGHSVDARSDIYSAGVVFYEMLTGRRPFQGSTASVMHKIVHDPPPPPSEIATGLAPQFDAILAKVLAKDPADRYSTTAEFAAALREVLSPAVPTATVGAGSDADDRTIVATPAPRPIKALPLPASQPLARRSRLALAGGGGLLLVVVGIIWLQLQPTAETQNSPGTAVAAATPPPAQAPAVAATLPPPASPAAEPKPPSLPQASQDSGVAAVPTPPAPPITSPEPPRSESAQAPPAPTAPVAAAEPLPTELPAIKQMLAAIPCSVFTGDVDAENIRLSGLTALGDASVLSVQSYVERSITKILPTSAVKLVMRRADGPYCSVFDTLKGVAVSLGPDDDRVALRVGDGPVRLAPDAPIQAQIALPGVPASITVDYFTSDGRVEHWIAGGSILAADRQMAVNGATEAGAAWKAGARPGIDILTVMVSSVSLFATKRPEQEAAAAYLKDLKSALEQAAGAGGSVAADITAVEVVSP